MIGRTIAAAGVGVAIMSGSLAAQVYRGAADMVFLSVTVTDARNRPLTGLDQASFTVFEDGQSQDIALFAADPQPIALSILIDGSTSMEQRLPVAQEAAIGFARRLRPGDVAQVLDFNSETQIRQAFTNDVALLDRAIRQIRTGGSTSLYTALYIALSEQKRVRAMSGGALRRQAVVLLSDGEDTTSSLSYDEVLDMAKRSDVAVYAIGLRDQRSPASRGFQNADFVLRTLSQATGGRAFFVTDIEQLSGIYGQIADELSAQYLIGYSSKNMTRDGKWRQVAVRVTRQEGVARTKTGYFAPAASR